MIFFATVIRSFLEEIPSYKAQEKKRYIEVSSYLNTQPHVTTLSTVNGSWYYKDD